MIRGAVPTLVDKSAECEPDQPYFRFLDEIRIDIRKSNLLGRPLYAKEELSTRMCPVHKGHCDGEQC